MFLNPRKRERGYQLERKMDERDALGRPVDIVSAMPLEFPDMGSEEELQLWQFPNDFDEKEWEW
ncbi:Uncharacterised protein [Pandoraea pulmonicola]|nr:Uncharacterised protein [Pandoraea pulmonicola]